MKTNNKGFSLVELIVVIAIMAILAAVAIPTFATFIGKAQVASDVDYMNQVESAIELAYAQKGYHVNTITVKYDATKQTPTAIDVVFVETDAQGAIKATLTKTGCTNEAADAAAVIDWDYKFNKVDYEADGKTTPENWDKDHWDLIKATN